MKVEQLNPVEEGMTRPGPPAGQDGLAGRPGLLNLYLADTRQLFNSLDPAPFRQRDLDPEASAYILDWARGVPKGQALSLILHLGGGPATDADAETMRKSVHDHFRRRALGKRRELGQLFRVGRYSLLIAMIFLALVIVVGESIASLISRERVVTLIQDSLVIGGWVALWRPLEIFLYDWWPIRAEARLFDRLGEMDVRTIGAAVAGPGTTGGSAP
jgi:hypothetical protein